MKKLPDHQKEKFVDAVAHLYLQHKRLDSHIEVLTLAIEIERWEELILIYDSLLHYEKVHEQISARLKVLKEIIGTE